MPYFPLPSWACLLRQHFQPFSLPPCQGSTSKGQEKTTRAPRFFKETSRGVTAVTPQSREQAGRQGRLQADQELSQTKALTLLTEEMVENSA